MSFSSFSEFKTNLSKNNFSQIYFSHKILNSQNIIKKLIDLVSVKLDAFIFESVEKVKIRGRYTIFGFNPDLIVEVNNNNIKKKMGKKISIIKDKNIYNYLDNLIKKFKFKTSKKLPLMSSMLAAYFGYDIIRLKEKIPNNCINDLNIPDAKLIRPQLLIIYDNQKKKIFFIQNIFNTVPKDNSKLRNLYIDKCNEIKKYINLINNFKLNNQFKTKSKNQIINSNIKKKKFLKSISKAKEFINKGEIFQVVLSQRFEAGLNKTPIDFYKKLRILNPSPFMFFFNFDNFQIAGSSPEILVRVRDKQITIRPIAGTRPRGKNNKDDIRLKKELLNDKKEMSEHLMLLDLGRNDVGKVSKIGTVKVNQKFKIEKYSHVMHIVSNVVGEFDNKNSLLDTLFSGFPAGTVSGAPKVRAMQIIDGLEFSRRKLYAGCIGYFTPNNEMDTCIALRTALIIKNKIYVQSGAGVVADSIPINEYKETVNKAKALFEAAK
jgi:anthranilate synthase component 1